MPRFLDLMCSAFFFSFFSCKNILSSLVLYFHYFTCFFFFQRSTLSSYWYLKQIICLIFTMWFILCLIGRKKLFFLWCLPCRNIQLKNLSPLFFCKPPVSVWLCAFVISARHNLCEFIPLLVTNGFYYQLFLIGPLFLPWRSYSVLSETSFPTTNEAL